MQFLIVKYQKMLPKKTLPRFEQMTYNICKSFSSYMLDHLILKIIFVEIKIIYFVPGGPLGPGGPTVACM